MQNTKHRESMHFIRETGLYNTEQHLQCGIVRIIRFYTGSTRRDIVQVLCLGGAGF
jgi:hypothetical protein